METELHFWNFQNPFSLSYLFFNRVLKRQQADNMLSALLDEVTRPKKAKMTLIKTMTARQNNPDEEVEGIQADNKP